VRALLRAVAGLVLWAAGFSIIYGVHGLACADAARVTTALYRWAILATWCVAIAGGAWLVWRARTADDFTGRMALAGAGIGLCATVATGVPILVFPVCL
jgi:hypothetical protein